MKIRFKLSIWLIIIMAVVVTIVTIMLIRQASGISYYLSVRSLGHLTSQRVEFWKGREDGYLRTLRTLANIMGDYESIQADERRDRYDDMLKSALEAEPQMISLYTVWKPNAIDEMDSLYINRTGSGPSGQYAIAFFKETGKIIGRTCSDIDNVTAYINSHFAHKDRVDNPSVLKIRGKNTNIIKLAVPIINYSNKKIVGALGCLLAIDTIQNIVENTMRTNNEIAMMAMYSGNGTILAHFMPERIGKRMIDADVEFGESRQEMFRAMQTGKPYMDTVYHKALNEKIIFIMKPFQIGNSGHNWSMLIGVPESFILKEVKAITNYTITLIITAFLITAIIVFTIIGFVTKPIVRLTDRLRDISEGEGDLTRLLPERGNDEITYMSRYFNQTLKKIKNLVIAIKQQAAVLSDSGNELSGNMSQTAAVITQISSNLKTVKSRLIDQQLSAAQTAAIIELNDRAEVKDDSYKIALENKYLGLVNEEISAEIDGIAAGTEQINTAVTRATEISEKNRKYINLLVRGASMFKIA